MLLGVATRQSARTLEPRARWSQHAGYEQERRQSSVRREDRAQLAAWQSTPLDALDLGRRSSSTASISASTASSSPLAIDHTGVKHALGLWDGSTETPLLCQSLFAYLQSRGLRTDRSLLVILDRSKALLKAVSHTFGSAALFHRCHVHKLRLSV